MAPSHAFYADDLVVFSKATRSGVQALLEVFDRYGEMSGQIVSKEKSSVFFGKHVKDKQQLKQTLQVEEGALPFTYLGVPIFKGSPKSEYFRKVLDKILAKLASWKGVCLSMAGRVQLVKSVIHGMSTYTLLVYSWPVGLIQKLESAMCNFIWTGDLHTKGLVTVRWDQLCKPVTEQGLGLRRLTDVNKAALIKLAWEFLQGRRDWCSFLKGRFFTGNKPISYHKSSAVWKGIWRGLQWLQDDTIWCIGDNSQVPFWTERWTTNGPFENLVGIPPDLQHLKNLVVGDLMQNGEWIIPDEIQTFYPAIAAEIREVSTENGQYKDEIIWEGSPSGNLTMKLAYEFYREKGEEQRWMKKLWTPYIPPKISNFIWRMLHDRLPTDDCLRKRGMIITSACLNCSRPSCEEDVIHLLHECEFIREILVWFSQVMEVNFMNFTCMWDLFKWLTTNNMQKIYNQVALAGICFIYWETWKRRNAARFENEEQSVQMLLDLQWFTMKHIS